MAKVCANHLAQLRHRPLRGLADVDQAQGHRHRSLLRRRLHRRRRTPRRSCSPIRRGGVYKKLVIEGRQAGRQRALRRHRRRRVVLQAAARRPQRRRDPRPPDVRRGEPRRHRSPGPVARARDGRRRRSLRLQRRVQGHDRQGDQGQGPVHARRRAQAHQGVVVVRLVHRPRRADPDGDGGRRLFGAAEAEADVRLHRSHAPGSARRDPRAAAAVDPGRDARSSNGARPTAARPAGPRSTTT